MSDGTSIEWTDATWNPIRTRNGEQSGWGCQRVSPGCEHCYAETINKRLGTGLRYDAKGQAAATFYLDEKALVKPLSWRKPRRIFVCSMTDLFGEWVPDEWIDRMFAVMAFAIPEEHSYQVLTKRAERMRRYLTDPQTFHRVIAHVRRMDREVGGCSVPRGELAMSWPLRNVWLGVSVEDQQRADERIPELLATPAAVRFLSCEPLLGPLDLKLDRTFIVDSRFTDDEIRHIRNQFNDRYRGVKPAAQLLEVEGINRCRPDWVIVGGESGAGARPMDIAWARSLVEQCQAAGVAVFVKQLGTKPISGIKWVDSGIGVYPSARAARARHSEPAPLKLHSRKGADMAEWPANLRVREMPR
jgi:protein gp37